MNRVISGTVVVLLLVSMFSSIFPITSGETVPNLDQAVIAEPSGPSTIDPAVCYDTSSQELLFNIYEPLIFFDKEKVTQFIPLVATSWNISSDGLTYTFTIRQNVTFHNNSILTTEDVKYSLERILVIESGPAWMFYDAFFNVFGSHDTQGNLLITGEQIDNAITRTDNTVTLHLVKPYPPLLQILSQVWSSILCKKWCVQLGDWPGTWENWTSYNQPQSGTAIENQTTEPPGPHLNAACGTGPYKLDYYQWGVEWQIVKFDDYWRGWPAAGSNSFLNRTICKIIVDWDTAKVMLLNGSLDSAYVPPWRIHDVLGQTGVRSIYPLPVLDCIALFFTFNITTSSPYLGVPGGLPSGTLNESGIPPDFFNDINVRKGFAYAFNYSKLIEEVYLGEASQPATPIVPGLPFYNPAQEGYILNLTRAAEYLEIAWNGQLWTNGFNLTICYATGNFRTQKFCEILKTNVESLNPKFSIQIQEISSAEYHANMFSGNAHTNELPIVVTGLQGDFADPHDFAYLILYSQGDTFASMQNYRNESIDTLVIQGMNTINETERKATYYELQRLYHEDCPSVPLYQSRGRRFERDWVQGWYYNPVLGMANYFYVMWKEAAHPYSISLGENTIDAVNSTNTMVLMNSTSPGNLTIRSYDINIKGTIELGIEVNYIKCVTVGTDVPPENITFPIEIRIYYTNQEVISAYVNESTLRMYYWNQTYWMLENDTGVVTPSDKPDYKGYVWARVNHLSTFAAIGLETSLHALSMRDLRRDKTIVGQGFNASVYADVANQGNFIETFNMTLYANTTVAGKFVNVTLIGGSSATLTFMWNTTGFSKGNYTVSVCVSPVPEETDSADNNLTRGWVILSIVGDITGPDGWPDGKCDMRDIGLVARNFGQNAPPANPNCDITGPTVGVPDGKIDMRDIGLVARHFGEHYS